MKIYTGAGDYGTTILARGTEVSKDDIRVETYGTIDELNSFIELTIDYVGSSVNLESSKLKFEDGKNFSGKISFTGSSFNTYCPYASLNIRLDERTSMKAFGGGDYYRISNASS